MGNRAFHAFLGRCKTLGLTLPDLLIRLFKILVHPVFTYGIQIWGVPLLAKCLKAPQRPTGSPLDNIQMHFQRRLSGAHGTAHHLSMLHEFGMLPIHYHTLKLAVRFWTKTATLPTTRMLHQALRSDLSLMLTRPCRKCWSYHFLHAMHTLGLCASPLSFTSTDECLTLKFDEKDIVECLSQRALLFCTPSLPPASLPRCPRTCPSEWVTGFTYRFWIGRKSGFAAPYLKTSMPPCHRQALTRLCLSNASIAVELGKRTGTARSQRFCQVHHLFGGTRPHFTHDRVEDIRHILLECPAYAAIRTCPKYAPIFVASDLPPAGQLRTIFAYINQSLLASCIYDIFTVRSLILSGTAQWGTQHDLLPPPDFQHTDWWTTSAHDDPSADDY